MNTNKRIVFYSSAFFSNLSYATFLYGIIIYSWDALNDINLTGKVFLFLHIPIILFMISAGKLADKINSIKLIIASQSMAIIFSLWLFIYLITIDNIEVNYYLLLIFLYSSAITYSSPARFAMLDIFFEKVEHPTIILNILKYITLGLGPVLIGVIYRYGYIEYIFMLPPLFLIFSNLLMLLLFKSISFSVNKKHINNNSFFQFLKKYFNKPYYVSFYLLLALLALTLVGTFQTLTPIFIKENLDITNEIERGAMMLPFSIGMIFGGLLAKKQLKIKFRGVTIFVNIVMSGLIFIGISLFDGVWVASFVFFLIGIFGGASIALISATIQMLTVSGDRGLATSLYSLILVGLTGAGGLLSTFVSNICNINDTYFVMGICLLILVSILYLGAKLWKLKINTTIKN